MSVEIVHAADYDFPQPTPDLHLAIRLAPATWETLRTRSFALSVVPHPAASVDRRDRWGNPVRLLRFDRSLTRLAISAHTLVSGERQSLPDQAPCAADLLLRADSPGTEVRRDRPEPAVEVAAAECAHLREGWRFEPHPEPERTSLGSLLRDRRGQCLELSRLLVWRLRVRGVPARHVVGYSLAPHRRGVLRQRHAWAAFHDGSGWRELDPSEPDRAPDALFATAWGPGLGALMPVRARGGAALSGTRGFWSTQVSGAMPARPAAGA